ncbi:hypothetical protein CRI94_02760 [Longibacter salinarum]|uniref:UspA domain-containing protein n=1 Tax=Longibacter salinarum TaxID=1850348 RepID=A0A2A8D2Q1_9BACT|nr:universal stress protein [Longibacter salinarum]PEN15219.1 hypothetical protein CRI94_02760 [Longibacter salinarum]
MTTQEILVPTDGSPTSVRALGYAAVLAERTGARIHIVNVDEREPKLSEVIAIRESDILDDLHADLLPRHDEFEDDEELDLDDFPEQTIQRTIICRSAAEGIVTYANENDIDIIIMGTHGRSGFERAVMGSVAEEVVRTASCPVLTACPRAGDIDPTHPIRPEVATILVPVDLSSATEEVIERAARAAKIFNASVELFHIIERVSLPPAYGVGAPALDTEAIERRAHKFLEEQASALENSGISVRVNVQSGHAATSILERVESDRPGLVVIGTHGFRGIKRAILGSVAEQVIRHAESPVLTIRTDHEGGEESRLRTTTSSVLSDE